MEELQLAQVIPDIVMINEVLPKSSSTNHSAVSYSIGGYDMFSNLDSGAKRGVSIYCKKDLKATEVEIVTDFQEATWCKVNLSKKDQLLDGCTAALQAQKKIQML